MIPPIIPAQPEEFEGLLFNIRLFAEASLDALRARPFEEATLNEATDVLRECIDEFLSVSNPVPPVEQRLNNVDVRTEDQDGSS